MASMIAIDSLPVSNNWLFPQVIFRRNNYNPEFLSYDAKSVADVF